MKLHLPLSLRSALLAVLALSSFSYAADVLQAEGGNIPDNPIQGNKPIYYVWATNILPQLRNAARANNGYIYDTITFTLNENLTREMNEDICFAGLVTLNLNGGTFNHKEGSFGRNANAVFNIEGGTYNMVDASSESFSTPEIGFGYGYTVTINLTGGNFVMNNMTAYIAREGAHAEITVGRGSTFTLQNGSIGYGTTSVEDEEQEGKYISKGSSVNLTVEGGGKLVMSGGRIGTMTGSDVENSITIKSGGSFSMSGGAIGDTANMALTVESGGTWILSNGNFTDSRGTIHLAGTGVSGNAIDQGGNAALFVNGSVSTAIAMAVTLDNNTTFNVYSPQDSVTFSGQYTFGGNQLTKLGQGNLKFTGGFTTTDAGSISIQRGVVTLDYKDANALRDYEISMGWMSNASDPSPGLQLGSGSYVIRNLTNIVNSGQRAMVYGSGTLVIDYSGSSAASTDAGMSGGGASLEKRGSGTQILTGSIDANAITVTQGTLTLGSSGQSIYTAGAVSVLGTLNLQSDANVSSLIGNGTIHAAGSLTVREGGSTSLTLAMADGATLAVQSGDFSANELSFDGSGTLSVSLTGGVHLDFGSISATSSITLSLSDAEISSLGADTYTLFSNWKDEWNSIFTFTPTKVGRNEVSFSGGVFSISVQNGLLSREGGNFTWDNSGSAADWTFGGDPDRFYNGDSVSFGGTGGTATISGDVVTHEMEVTSGTWNFVGATGSLQVVSGLRVTTGATANFAHPSVSIAGGVTNEGSLTFSGAELELRHSISSSGALTISSAQAEVGGLMSIIGGTATFSGRDLKLNGGLSISGGTSVFTGASVSIAGSLSITGGEVTFSGTTTTLTGSAHIIGGTISFIGDNLNATNLLSIGNNGTAIIKMTNANDATAANSPTLGAPATGRSLGKVTVAEGGRLVVYGYNDNTDTSYTWKQNTSLTDYTSVSGDGTLEFCDLGYQVLSGEAISPVGDQYGNTSRGSSILFRFISTKSNETNLEKIHIVELSTRNKEHATSLVFDRGDPSNGWNPATALLKRIGEIHVKDGAALGFTGRYLDDDSQTGAQSGAKVFETTHGVLHLAGQGTNTGEIYQGSNAALYVNSENSLAVNVSMPWDVVLDDHTSINTYTKNSGITFTGSYDGGTYTLTKLGAGTMTFGESFTTAEGSSGAITASRGNLVFAYEKSDALKNYSINISQFNASEKACLTLQGGSYAICKLSGGGLVTGSGTLEFTLSEGSASFESDIIATEKGDRISLIMSGTGEQIISGTAALKEVTMNAGTLTLGTATMDTLSGSGGTLNATGSLTIGRVSAGTSLAALTMKEGSTKLQIDGGTLAGGTLSLGSNSTLAVSLEGGTLLDFDTMVLGTNITLELLDLYLPAGISTDTPYQLFEKWKDEYKEHISMGESKLGRATVVFDDDNGTITIQGADRADLVWDGTTATWQATTQLTNWDNQGRADSFYNGDNVTFDTAGSHSVTISGTVIAGNMTVQQGEITLRNSPGEIFSVSGTLTVAAGATLSLDTASTTLRGEVEVQSGASLTLNSATTRIEDTITISGGTLKLGSGVSVVCEGDILIESGAFNLSGAFTTNGSITLGKDGGAASMTVQAGHTKMTLGQITVNKNSALTLNGGTYDTENTSISGGGTLELKNFGTMNTNAEGGIVGSMLGGNIGTLKTSGNTIINFTAASAALTDMLNGIGEIYVTSGSAIGFSAEGINALVGSSGTLHLVGAGNIDSNNAALFVSGSNVNARLTWDVTLEGNTTINTVASQANIILSGTLNANGYTITKNGQGFIITGEDFDAVSNGKGGTLLISRSGLTLGHINNPNALKDYTLQMGYFNGTGPNCTLTLLSGGSYAIGRMTAHSSAAADKRSIITGNGTLEIWSADTSTVYADITAGEGGRVSLTMKGSGSQTISGGIVVENITVDAGKLILGGAGEGSINASGSVALNAGELTLQGAARLANLTIGAGKLTTSGSLNIEQATVGTATTYGDISVGGDLTLGGGTLKGGTLTLNGTLTVSLSQGAHLDFATIATTSGIKLALADAVMPAGYGKEKSYQLFENWDAAAMADKISFEEMVIGRMTATFNKTSGAIDFDGDVGELTWLTDGASDVWQNSEESALNWNHDGEPDYFISGDHVIFDDAKGEAIALHGSVFSGNVTVKNGSWTFADTPDSENSLTIGGALTIESGASLSLTNASTTLTQGAISGSLAVAATAGFTNSGALTIESGGSMSLSSGAGSSAKTIGNVTVNAGGTLIIEGRETVYGNNYANYLAKNTAEQTFTAVSGEGSVELRGVYGYVWSSYNVLAIGDDGGILASLFPVAGSEASKGKVGALRLTEQTALGIQTSSGAMKNILSHIDSIHVASGSSLGFTGGSSDVLIGSSGTFHIAGSGTGRGASDASGKYGALFVSGEIMVNIPWDIVVDAAGAALYTAPGDYGQNIMRLTGALTLDGAKLTKLGNGLLELAEGFTTRAAAGKTQDSGTLIIGNEDTTSSSLGGGTLVLNFTGKDALAGYVIALNHTGNNSGNLTVYDSSAGAESHSYRVKAISDDKTQPVLGKYASQNKRAIVMGYGTLIIDTGTESYTSQAGVGGGIFGSTPTLTLVKEGSGEQKILGQIIALASTVKEGTLTLGSSGNTVQVKDALTAQDNTTLNIGGDLTVGTLCGAGKVAAQGALTLAGDITAFSGTLDATADGSQWKLIGEQAAAITLAAKLSGDISIAYASAHDVTLSGGAAIGSTLANAMTGIDEAAPGALVLEGAYTGTTLDFHSTEIRLGSATAAATWSGALSGSGTLTLVSGSLGAALTSAAMGSVTLAVDAAGAVDVSNTAGALLSSISIREGGSLSGVSGDIDTATTGVSIVLGTSNIGTGGSGMITSSGDLRITDTAAFSIGFSAEAFAELLKADGKDIYLQVLNGGGSVKLASGTQLSDILESNYGQLLTSYELVKAEGGSIVIYGNSKDIYLVLADGSRDADTIHDYTALDDRIATVVDESTTLTLELGDSSERKNTLTINNLVGLKGSMLHISKTGSKALTIELNNSDNGLNSSSGLPGGLDSGDVRGIDTEFKGTIVADNEVTLRKIGIGTLYVGEYAKSAYSLARSAADNGGMQVDGVVSIREGAIVVRGERSKISSLSFDYEKVGAADESRGFAADGSSIAIHSIAENGAYTADNNITLENSGEIVFDGKSELSSTTFSAGTGGGTLTVADDAELTLIGKGKDGQSRIDGANVQVSGGELALTNGASVANGNISVVNGGHMQIGNASGISGGNVQVQSGSLTMDDNADGLHTAGSLEIGKEGLVDMGNTSAEVGGLSGDGELKGGSAAELEIQGTGSSFSGTLGGDGGTLCVADDADFTLKDARTSTDARWNARVRTHGSFTVDVEATSRETHLGDITLENDSIFTYKYDTGRSSNLNAHIVLDDDARADFVIYSDGATIAPDEDVDLPGITFTGDSDSLKIKLRGKAFVQYSGNAHLKEGESGGIAVGVEKVKSNLFLTPGMHKNARAGAIIFWDAFDTQGNAWQHMQEHLIGDLAKFTDALYAHYEAGQDMSRMLAAGAGASVSALGAALQEDMRRQLSAVRNRSTYLTDTDKPGEIANVWINAETNYLKQNADGLAPGFTLNGWGGTVGADWMLDKNVHAGLSLTAMYNDLKVDAADHARGDLDTTYLSAFSRVKDAAWTHTFIMSVGAVRASLNRSVNYGADGYSTSGSTDGITFAAMYELGYTLLLSDDGSEAIQPLVSVQFRHAALKGYSEGGSDAALRVDNISTQVVTISLGARYMAMADEDMLSAGSTFELRALLKADIGDRVGTAQTSLLLGSTKAEVESARAGAVGLEIGAGVNIPVDGSDSSFFAEVSAEFRSNYANFNATIGYKLHF